MRKISYADHFVRIITKKNKIKNRLYDLVFKHGSLRWSVKAITDMPF